MTSLKFKFEEFESHEYEILNLKNYKKKKSFLWNNSNMKRYDIIIINY